MKFLYSMGAPRNFYQWTTSWTKFFAYFGVVGLMVGWTWGLWIAPPDYQQGDSVRIIYMHVPAAFLSLSIYTLMASCAFCVLVWRIKIAGLMMKSCAQVGLFLTCMALVTGSIWGKPTWGTWWVWDARLTGEFVLLLIYASLLALFQTLGTKESSYRVVAIITWVGLIDLPIIHYSVQWWNTLHQGSTLLVLAKPKIHTSMLYPLLISLVGLSSFSAWAILSLTRQALLQKDYRQQWVKNLLEIR